MLTEQATVWNIAHPQVTVTVEVVEGDNVGTAIVTEARQMKATMVVLGKCESQMPLSPK